MPIMANATAMNACSERAGAAHPRDDVTSRIAVAQLVADAVRDTAHHHAIQAQAGSPQQQCPAVQPPGQRGGVAQSRARCATPGAFGDQSGADVTPGQQPIGD